jgi:sorbitol-specific phosphotransferase system component IIBC
MSNTSSLCYHVHTGPIRVKVGEGGFGSHLQLEFEGTDITIFTQVGAAALVAALASAVRAIENELGMNQSSPSAEIWVGDGR